MYARLGAIATNPTMFQRVAPTRSCTSIGCVTCTPDACTGTGTWFGVFTQLQQLANAAAAATGKPQRVNVDGVIRQDTADLVSKLGAASSSLVLIFLKIDPPYVASHARAIIDRLTQIAGVLPGGGDGSVFSTNPGPFVPLVPATTTDPGSTSSTASGGPPTSSDGALLPAGPSATVTAPVNTSAPSGILQTIGDAPLGYKLAAGAAVLAAVAVGASLFRRHHKA